MGFRTIEFEDKGQDFLEWDVTSPEGSETVEVIACRPCQAAIWVGTKIANETIRPGLFPVIKNGGVVATLRHRIASVSGWKKVLEVSDGQQPTG